MSNFTPISALLGGLLIGAASVWLLAANGRIAGVSGIVQGIFTAPAGGWRIAFVAGLILAGVAWQSAGAPAPVRTSLPLGWVAVAGLLVGFGTRLSGGCTSGHGICGLARLSARSLTAVLVFMGVAMVTTYVTRHLLGVPS